MVVAIGQLRPMTIDDLEAFPDDGSRREILRGELIVTPAPTPVHQLLVTRLVALLSNFANSTNAGFVLTAPIDVQLTRYDVVQPDVVFVAREREALLRGTFIEGAPDWWSKCFRRRLGESTSSERWPSTEQAESVSTGLLISKTDRFA